MELEEKGLDTVAPKLKVREQPPVSQDEGAVMEFCSTFYRKLRKADFIPIVDLFSFQLIGKYDKSEWGAEEVAIFVALKELFSEVSNKEN